MKNKFKLFGIIALVTVIGLSMASNSSATLSQPDFYGTWYSPRNVPPGGARGNFDITVVISADKLVYSDTDGDGFTFEDLVWRELSNPVRQYQNEFPRGFEIVGTITENKGYFNNENIGEKERVYFFINADRQRIARYRPSQGAIHSIYSKQ